jgi:hypothetical protein
MGLRETMRSVREHRPCNKVGMKTRFQVLPAVALASTIIAAGCGNPPGKPGTATVKVDFPSRWDGTAEVLVHRPDGTQVSRAALGSPSTDLAIEDGDTVTVALGRNGGSELRSFTGVEAGDTIRVRSVILSSITDPVDVRLPATVGANHWAVWSPSSAGKGTDAPMARIDVPAGRTSLPILATAYANGAAIAMYADKAAAITANGIDLQPSVSFRTIEVRGEHAPAGATVFGSAGIVFGQDLVPLLHDANAPGITLPVALGDAVQVTAITMPVNELFLATATSKDATGAVVTLDLSVASLPAISGFQADAAGHSLTWTAAGGGDYDATMISIQPKDTKKGPMWSIIVPPGETGVTLPSLPADLAPPPATAYTVATSENSAITSYHDFLAEPTPAPTAGSAGQERMLVILPPSATSH